MRTIKCDVPGCDFVAKHETGYVKCILGCHKSRAHGIRGKLWKYSKAGKKEQPSTSQPGNSPVEQETINIPNFCPNCGLSIRHVTAAMNMRRGR